MSALGHYVKKLNKRSKGALKNAQKSGTIASDIVRGINRNNWISGGSAEAGLMGSVGINCEDFMGG